MVEFQSALFAGDALLEAIADDLPSPDGGLTRISPSQNQDDPAVAKVQQALLDWRADALPGGANGVFGNESVEAVMRFKREELGVAEGDIIGDVGPRTVRRLDEIRIGVEAIVGADAVCHCPRHIRVVPSVLAEAPITCAKCTFDFEVVRGT
jgi:peptidoglycan hydrolase-like protein with peptidoglycan-binding domain